MYDKVPTDLKFVEREKEVEKFWEDEHILRRVLRCVKAASHMYSMMDRQPQTVSHISAMLRPV